jgi:hypothetical protein
LILGGTNQPAGTYGSTNSPAANQSSFFTNAGTVTVTGSLANLPATSVSGVSAVLRAALDCNGTNYAVFAHWNTVNGGTNIALWTNSAYVGEWINVAASLDFTAAGLTPSRNYHFTFRATNGLGTLWATNVLSFTTLPPLTDPLLAGAFSLTNGQSRFSFPTVAGYQYRLLFKDEMTNALWSPLIAPPDFPPPDGWSPVSTGGAMLITDPGATNVPRRFYLFEALAP